MMKTGRKILSWFLTVVLCITTVQLFPLPTTKADGDMVAHVHDGITFEAWTSNNSLPSTAGSYYLTKDVTINSEWVIQADINLCLNGHTITNTISGNQNVISIGSGKHFTLFDCEGTGKITHTVRSNGTVWVSGGHFVMYGGEINDNPNNWGVHTGDGGSFTMYGGTITGMKDMSRAAVADASSNGTFNLYGGTISGNKIGVNVSNGNVNLSGNMIIKNNTDGNLYIADGKTVNIVGELTEGASIGVTMANTTGTFTSGITDATTAETYKAFFTSDNNAFGVMVDTSGQLKLGNPPAAKVGDTEYAAFADALSAWTAGTTLQLFTDVTTSSTITVPSGEHTLDLNGHGICMTGSDSVITVPSSATLKLYDSDTTTEHRFTVADAASNGAGLATVNDALTSGYQTFTGGYITGGKGRSVSSWREGGGIYIEGTVEMYGGTIIGNGVYGTTHGGAIVPRAATAKFIMYGGELRNNAALCGGAFRYKGGTVEIRGGKIRYNKASGDGGAIHDGVQLLENCEVSNNYAQNGPGGGVWIYSTTTTQMKVSGSTVISGNLKGSGTSNVELNNGSAMITVGTLESGASIGVTMNNAQPGVFTSGITDATTAETYKAFFTSDNNAFEVIVDISGQLKIGNPPAAKVGDTEYATFADALSAWTAGTTLQLFTDVTTSSTITVPSGEHTLDLNGYGIKMTGSGSVFSIGNGVTLTVKDSRPTETTHNFTVSSPASNGAGFATVGSGSQSFTGGYITGGIAQFGGGICVNAGGVLYFDGGTVIGNKTNGNASGVKDGGGICALGGTVYVRGGEICYNEGANAGGGGLATRTQPNNTTTSAGTIYVSGGSIHHNVASTGGGIRLDGTNSKLYVSGGMIENNVYTGVDPAGGIRVDGYGGVEIHMSGNPVIRNNTNSQGEDSNLQLNQPLTIDGELTNTIPIGVKTGIASGVFTTGWSDYMADKDPEQFFTSENSDYIVWKNTDGELEISLPPMAMIGDMMYTSLASAVSAWTDGSTLKLIDDVTTDSTITVPSGEHTLDLNGYGIKMTGSGGVISIPDGASLTINDSNPTVTHNYTISSPSSSGAGLATVGSGDKSFTGGYITGGNNPDGGGSSGGGITVKGNLTMNGGTVIGNYVAGAGGGISKLGSGTMTLTGTNIIGNVTGNVGAGIDIQGNGTCTFDSCVFQYNHAQENSGGLAARGSGGGVVTLKGCIVKENSVAAANQNQAFAAAGIVAMNCHLTLDGVSITDNVCEKKTSDTQQSPGLILLQHNSFTNFSVTLKGTITIRNNKTAGVVDDSIAVHNGRTIKIDSTFSGNSIKIKMDTAGVFTSTTDISYNDPDQFASANTNYMVAKNNDGQLFLTPPYTISYKANSGSGTMETKTVGGGVTTTLDANSFTRTYYDFTGWNTAADGSGTSYSDAQQVTLSGNLTLYAQWQLSERTITFDANGGSGTMDNQVVLATTSNALTANRFYYAWYDFTGWNTKADGSGVSYQNQQDIVIYEDVTLYAQWKQSTRKITFNANGGEGIMGEQTVKADVKTTLNANKFTRKPYNFIGWNTAADGTGDSYTDECGIILYGDLTLYAQWAINTRTVTFNANGGKGQMSPQDVAANGVTALTGNAFTRAEYTFKEWNTAADGSGKSYQDKQMVTLSEDITLYAQWGVVQEAELKLTGTETNGIQVSGLDDMVEELMGETEEPYLLTMTVASRYASQAPGASAMMALAEEISPEMTMQYFEITLESTSNGVTEEIKETPVVLEIKVPYQFKGKEEVTIYRYNNGKAERMNESSSKADGTCYLDRDAGVIYIYASSFDTYAIGGLQCYNVGGTIECDGSISDMTMKLVDADGQEYSVNCGVVEGNVKYDFTHIPQGTYQMIISWTEDGNTFTTETQIEIRKDE